MADSVFEGEAGADAVRAGGVGGVGGDGAGGRGLGDEGDYVVVVDAGDG